MAPRKKIRAREAQLAFEALTIEGGLLSPEWLSKVAQLQATHQTGDDYGLDPALTLRDEIGRFWRIAQGRWSSFRDGREKQADPTALAERFIVDLLSKAFGFESLVSSEPVVLGQRSYPIGFTALEGRVPIVIAPAASGLDALSSTFGEDSRRRSAFGLVQELLNADERALWGVATDGLTLRLCRDNASLTRPAWIEADLGRIFTEERFADFAALWLLLHESRFGAPGQPMTDCALEAWRSAGREQGTRAREKLREGVEEALVALGRGFLTHADNQPLRAALHGGQLTRDAYFQQLLRLVYRVIFLLTAEERGVLHPPDATELAKGRYEQGYGLRRLRDRAAKRSAHDRFSDLWEGMKITFRGVATGESRLALPALGGLFAKDQCPDLDAAKVENRWLMAAVFRLSWIREDGGLSRVNWRDMGPEELGSVYESLLELVPQIPEDGRGFAFATGDETKGNARKTSGSYYTPDSLVQVLLDSALEPVIQATVAAHPEDPAEALLKLTVVDPACGSGHFLLAAARRLAVHVARHQANGTPSAEQYRHAVRQVVSRCLFGVDLNPMAVELCKVSLWMEAVEPGLPLSFLDSHIQRGNALLGATPELLAKGIPDAAFEPIEGDDRKVASALKKRNRAEAGGQRTLALGAPRGDEPAAVASAVAALEAASDASLPALSAKQAQWGALLGSVAFRHQKLVADAWCAAFVWPKQSGPHAEAAPTNETWRQLLDGRAGSKVTIDTVEELAAEYDFFHWHLAFPHVFAGGGFDVVLGNPPWEHPELKEEEWFAQRRPEISAAANAAARKRMIAELRTTDATLHSFFLSAGRGFDAVTHFARSSGRFPLCARGRVNTYALFAEHNRAVLGPRGRAGFIVPTGIATDEGTSGFLRALVAGRQFQEIVSYENQGTTFGGVNNRQSFCLLTVSRVPVPRTRLTFLVNQPLPENAGPLDFELVDEDFALFNPNTGNCPTFRTRRDAGINLAMYRRAGILWREDDAAGNPWGLRFMQGVFNMASDSGLFRTRSELEARGATLSGNRLDGPEGEYLPLIEAKMLQPFDHRYGTYEGATQAHYNKGFLPRMTDEDHGDPAKLAMPDAWVANSEVEKVLEDRWARGWLLGWRDICRRTDIRTVVAALIPRTAVGHTTPLFLPNQAPCLIAALYANLCSFALDYAARQKVGGTHLTYGYLKQLPVLPPATYAPTARWQGGETLVDWVLSRVLELTYTAWDLEPFARDVGYHGPPFRWDPDRRFLLRAELDAAFFHLYGLSRDDTTYVLDTFPIVRRNDEKAHGEYRTKRVILDVYDAMAEAIRTKKPYDTPLDPRPAAPGASHGVFSSIGVPKDYAEALRMGLLFTLIRWSGDAGISQRSLSRALLWLEDAKHTASWLEGSAHADFARVLAADPLLAQGASQVTALLGALDDHKVITRDAKGIARLRAGSAIPNWLPQTPALARLASLMRAGLKKAEAGASTAPAGEKVPTGKAKRA